MNPVVHFEFPAVDRKRISDFYSKVFGWKTQQLDAKYNDYVMAMTTEVDEKKMPKEKGRINGGFYQKKDDPSMPLQYPSVVISVPDIKAHIKKVEAAGGKVLGEPWDIPGVGLYVSFIDTERNRVSMMQLYNQC